MLLVAVISLIWFAVMTVVVAMCILAKAGDAALAEPRPNLRLVRGTPGEVASPVSARSTVLH